MNCMMNVSLQTKGKKVYKLDDYYLEHYFFNHFKLTWEGIGEIIMPVFEVVFTGFLYILRSVATKC